MAKKKPTLQQVADDLIGKYGTDFSRNLREIAIIHARHEVAEYVLARHVDEAFSSLSRMGLNRRPFYKRPELEVGAGSAVIGVAGTVCSFADVLLGDGAGTILFEQCICVSCLIVGFGLIAHGWIRGQS